MSKMDVQLKDTKMNKIIIFIGSLLAFYSCGPRSVSIDCASLSSIEVRDRSRYSPAQESFESFVVSDTEILNKVCSFLNSCEERKESYSRKNQHSMLLVLQYSDKSEKRFRVRHLANEEWSLASMSLGGQKLFMAGDLKCPGLGDYLESLIERKKPSE